MANTMVYFCAPKRGGFGADVRTDSRTVHPVVVLKVFRRTIVWNTTEYYGIGVRFNYAQLDGCCSLLFVAVRCCSLLFVAGGCN